MKIDKELIEKIANGDERAFTLLYNTLSNSVVSYIDMFVQDYQISEDITLDMFSKLPQFIHQYDPKKSKFTTWLYRVARNRALSYIRSRQAKRELQLDEAIDINKGSYTIKYDNFQVEELAEILTDLEYKVVVLIFVYEYDLNEIARNFNVTRAKIKSVRRTAFVKIKKYYNKTYPDDCR